MEITNWDYSKSCFSADSYIDVSHIGDPPGGHIGGWIITDPYFYETFEEKIERMKLDSFIKEYPMFSEMKYVLKILKSGIRIYSNSIMDIVRFRMK